MQLISLNTWGGRAGRDGVMDFFKTYKGADFFCLQEMWSAPYDEYDGHSAGGLEIDQSTVMTEGVADISGLLEGTHSSFFHPHFLDNYGLLILTTKNFPVRSYGDHFVYLQKGHVPEGDIGNHARNIQYVTLEKDDSPFTIINFHGLWNGQGKGDSEARIQQSQNIIGFLKTLDHPFVLTGDFNLLPDTESIRLLEAFGLRNLIKEYNIQSTRTSYYEKPVKFADYTFVSPGITVSDFRVMDEEVSDHAALFLDFDLT